MTAIAAPLTPVRTSRFRRSYPPYALGIIGAVWLILFFLIPILSGLLVSLMTGNATQGYSLTWNWGVYADIFTGGGSNYGFALGRSFFYGAIATVLTIAIGYPVAYYIALRVSPRWKSPLLALVMVTFLVSFVIRTRMWVFILGNDGPVIETLAALHLVDQNFSILHTPGAVIFGQTYNDLAYMVLPIYVALERIDPRLFEATEDLYGSKRAVFFKTILPLSRSGIFSGILIVFIDTVGDPVNSALLGGGPGTNFWNGTFNFGQGIQNAYLATQQYNVAAALSTVLMLCLGIVLFAYARIFGTQNIEDLV